MMNPDIKTIFELLQKQRFSMTDEKAMQREIEQCFKDNNIQYDRERMLDGKNFVDFVVHVGETKGIAIEVKIKGQKRAIYNQCVRYCNFLAVTHLILLTSVSTGMPPEINGKPIYVLNISKAWL